MNLNELERNYPEWRPWLAAIGMLCEALNDAQWNSRVTFSLAARAADAPRLANATVGLDGEALEFFGRLVAAVIGGTTFALPPRFEPSLVASALNGDENVLAAGAARAGVDDEAFVAAVALGAMPVLHALARRVSSEIAADWTAGYCPVCGAWPALAETCGVERSRFLRCGRCGSAWRAHVLSCPYCGTIDHAELASLTVEEGGSGWVIEVCRRCHGYLKSFTRLRSGSPRDVLVDDLGSVALDLAAVERGYRRPPGLGCPLDLSVSVSPPPRS